MPADLTTGNRVTEEVLVENLKDGKGFLPNFQRPNFGAVDSSFYGRSNKKS
jgi:hypothetical protein